MADWGRPDPMNQAMMQFALGQGQFANPSPYAPSFSPQQYSLFGQNVPQDPEQLDYERDATNLIQDQVSNMFSPENMFLSAPHGLDPTAFEDIVSYEQVQRPGYDFLARQMQGGIDPATGQPMPQTTWNGMVAEEIMVNNGSANSAYSKARQILDKYADGSGGYVIPEEDPLAKQLFFSLPTWKDEFSGRDTVDWKGALDNATSWEQMYAEDPKPGPQGAIYSEEGEMVSPGGNLILQRDAQGNEILVAEQREQSPVSELFAEYGLPSPYDKYEAADFMGPDWAAGEQAYQGAMQEQQGMKSELREGRAELRGQRKATAAADEDYQKAMAKWISSPESLTDYGREMVRMAAAHKWAEDQPGPVAAGTEIGAWKDETEAAAGQGGPSGSEAGMVDTMRAGRNLQTGAGPSGYGGTSAQGLQRQQPAAPLGPTAFMEGVEGPVYARNTIGAAPQTGGRGPNNAFGYTAPGETLDPRLAEAQAMYKEKPEELVKQRKELRKTRKRTQGMREEFNKYRGDYRDFQEQTEGAHQELYNTAEYGSSLAKEWIMGQEQRTPYVDALMARRMVPVAMGANTSSYLPYGS